MNEDLLSPQGPRFARSDSLVFSITAQKNDSPHDTDLLRDSSQLESGKEITQLNSKLGALQRKVKSIKTQQAESSQALNKENIDISNLTLGQESFKAGRFHKKTSVKQANKIINNNSSFNVTVRNNHSYSRESRASHHSHKSYNKEKEILSMRKEMLKMRMKMEQTQRSRSKCSQKLSESKQSLKILQNNKKNNEKVIATLVKDLKKSENIRKKQKQTILKQKKQIEQLKNLLSVLKTGLRV